MTTVVPKVCIVVFCGITSSGHRRTPFAQQFVDRETLHTMMGASVQRAELLHAVFTYLKKPPTPALLLLNVGSLHGIQPVMMTCSDDIIPSHAIATYFLVLSTAFADWRCCDEGKFWKL